MARYKFLHHIVLYPHKIELISESFFPPIT